MAERDIEKLLGGYATGTLTDEERRRLFEAALGDQALFDALTSEDALKEVLDDPKHRRRLLAALGAQQQASRRPFGAVLEWFRRPANLALAGTLATAVIAAWILIALERERAATPSADELVAQVMQSAEQPGPHPDPPTERDTLEPSGAGGKLDAGGPVSHEKSAESAHVAERRSAEGPAPSAGRAAVGAVTKPSARSRPAQPKARARSFRDLPKEEPRAASPVAPPAVSGQGRPVWLTSYRRPVERGPARHLYYARLAPTPRWEAEEMAPPKPSQREPAEQALGLEGMASLEAGASPGTLKPFGLRYSVLKQDEHGDFAETNPDGPFKADDAMRVTVEVNETGYLYVFRLGPRGEWLWISPSGPLGKEERESGVGVLSGKRYVIPGTGILPLYGAASANKMILIYSRQPRQELQVFHPAVLERREGDERPSADLETLLGRARVETSTQPLLIEQVQPDKPEGPQERAVYIVSPEAGRDAAIAIELTLSSE